MKVKSNLRKGLIVDNKKLIARLGRGGNGEVWECEYPNGDVFAIKFLKKIKPTAYQRFKDETAVVEQNSDIEGIMPLIEKKLPDNLDNETPYFVMPLASLSEKLLIGRSMTIKVKAIIQLAETLSKLHAREIFHRDIKPANILYYNSRHSFVDFGLVEYPNKKDVSQFNEEIGAKWTMAPEMKRESSKADGAKADVYSLAKTLWILFTENKKGFDGQYSISSIIELKKYYPKDYTTPIDDLLIKSTDNDPIKRPKIIEFCNSLKEWLRLSEDFHALKLEQWFEIQTLLFPTSIPTRVEWHNVNDIVKILSLACHYQNLNHLFFPNGGGMDLISARLAHEEGCIELDFQPIDIVKPKVLIFESFNNNPEWNYFRLELDTLEPTKFENFDDEDIPKSLVDNHSELVSELSPGQYFPYDLIENADFYRDRYYIPRTARHIKRWFQGSFVIFGKRSSYNLNPTTYDGRHNKMTTDEFREYIQKYINSSKKNSHLHERETRTLEKNCEKEDKIRHHLEYEKVFRCGWCGNIVDKDGSELKGEMRMYKIHVREQFGSEVEIRVNGECCANEWS